MSARIVVKNILLLSLITLIIRAFGIITINFSNYIYDPRIFMQTTIMYALFYIILIIGWKPSRYYHIFKILYKMSGVLTKYIKKEDDILLYIRVFDSVVLFLIGFLIIRTNKLTANIMKTLAVITGLRFACKFFWGYRTVKSVILTDISMTEQEQNIKANDLMLKKMANADYDVLYENMQNVSDSYNIYKTLETPDDRKNFILLKMLELESNKKLDSNNTAKYIDELTSKIDELKELKKSSQELLSCMKKSVPELENSLNKIK